jgi:glutaredoxin-like protein
MALLSENVIKELKDLFKNLKEKVTLKYFTQDMECRFCKDTRDLVEEVANTSDKIDVDIFDFVKDKKDAEKYGIDKIPGLVVIGKKDHGIRFYGIPSGYEFSSLIEAIKLVSTGETSLSSETKKFLDSLDKEIHLQVFVTPTCPYCPGAVILAHQMAFYSPKVKADMVEATEFPQLSQKYQVMGVPRTVINEKEFQEGAAPENLIVDKIKAVLS